RLHRREAAHGGPRREAACSSFRDEKLQRVTDGRRIERRQRGQLGGSRRRRLHHRIPGLDWSNNNSIRSRRIAWRDVARGDGREPSAALPRLERQKRWTQRAPRRIAGQFGLQRLEGGKERIGRQRTEEALYRSQVVAMMTGIGSLVREPQDQT